MAAKRNWRGQKTSVAFHNSSTWCFSADLPAERFLLSSSQRDTKSLQPSHAFQDGHASLSHTATETAPELTHRRSPLQASLGVSVRLNRRSRQVSVSYILATCLPPSLPYSTFSFYSIRLVPPHSPPLTLCRPPFPHSQHTLKASISSLLSHPSPTLLSQCMQ